MARSPKLKVPKSVLLELPNDLALDLAAFSEAHYGAPHVRIVREAIRRFIDVQLNAEPALRQRFNEARALLAKTVSDTIRLLDSSSKAQ